MTRGKWERDEAWWKTYDYKSGHTYILGEKFTGKTAAMEYAKSCGMIVIAQSTVPLSDLEYENALLKTEVANLKKKEGTP